MRRGKNQIRQGGFTLIEVMIALVIFSIGILGVLGMQISSIRGNDTAADYSHALALGQSQLDTLLTLPYGHDDLLDITDDDLGGLDHDTATTADGSLTLDGKYNLFWNVAVDQPVPNAKQIRMIVQWQTGSGTSELTLETVRMR